VVRVGAGRSGADLDVEVDDGVEPALAVRLDGVDHASGHVVAAVSVRERERRRLAEPVVLEPGETRRGRLGRHAVDHAGVDAALLGAQPEVGVSRRDHRVAGGEEGGVAVFRRREDRLRILLDALARPDLYLRVVVRFQVVDVGADQSAGVELGKTRSADRSASRPSTVIDRSS